MKRRCKFYNSLFLGKYSRTKNCRLLRNIRICSSFLASALYQPTLLVTIFCPFLSVYYFPRWKRLQGSGLDIDMKCEDTITWNNNFLRYNLRGQTFRENIRQLTIINFPLINILTQKFGGFFHKCLYRLIKLINVLIRNILDFLEKIEFTRGRPCIPYSLTSIFTYRGWIFESC